MRARCRRDKRGRSNGRRRACEALVRAMIAACALSSRRGRVRTCGSSRWYGRTAYVPAAARGWRGARRRWCWCANCAVGGVASPLPSFLYCAVSLILLRFESHRRAAAMPGYGSGAAVTRSTPSGVGSCSRGSDRRVVFRVFRVRELAGKGGSASEAPPLNPPRRSKGVGAAHRHNSRQQASATGQRQTRGQATPQEASRNQPQLRRYLPLRRKKTRARNRDAQRHQYAGAREGVAPVSVCAANSSEKGEGEEGGFPPEGVLVVVPRRTST